MKDCHLRLGESTERIAHLNPPDAPPQSTDGWPTSIHKVDSPPRSTGWPTLIHRTDGPASIHKVDRPPQSTGWPTSIHRTDGPPQITRRIAHLNPQDGWPPLIHRTDGPASIHKEDSPPQSTGRIVHLNPQGYNSTSPSSIHATKYAVLRSTKETNTWSPSFHW